MATPFMVVLTIDDGEGCSAVCYLEQMRKNKPVWIDDVRFAKSMSETVAVKLAEKIRSNMAYLADSDTIVAMEM